MYKIIILTTLTLFLIHLDAQVFEKQWVFQTNGKIFASVACDSNKLFIGSGDGTFYCLNKENGTLKWKISSHASKFSSTLIDDNNVYFGTNEGLLYALDKTNGVIKWQFQSKGEQEKDIWDYYLSNPSIKDDCIYWGSGDSTLYAIGKDDGKEKWHFKTKGIIHANPIETEGMILVSSFDGYLYCLNSSDGSLNWKFKTLGAEYFPEGAIPKSPLVHEGIIYLGSRDYNLYALELNSGRCLWNYREPDGWIVATPVYYNGCLYFGLSDGHRMVCMNTQSGTVKWQTPINMRIYGEAIILDDYLVFGSHNGILYALNPNTGEIIDTWKTNGNKANYDKVFDNNGQFLPDFKLYGEEYKKSEEMILNLGSILSTPLFDDGFIYFGSSDGGVYSIKWLKP